MKKENASTGHSKEANEINVVGKKANDDYTISAPKGWTKIDTIFMGQSITFLKSSEEDDDNFLENVNVVTETIGNAGMKEYFEKSLATMKSGLIDFIEGQAYDKTINGIEFKNLKYSHNYNGIDLDVDVYWAIKNEKGYVITCTTTKGGLTKWQPIFDEVINSFSFN